MAGHETAVKEATTVPKGRERVDLGHRAGKRTPDGAIPEPLAALAALDKGQVGVLSFPPSAREELNQWRAGLWSAANQLRRSHPERGLLCTTVREEEAGPALYFWYIADGEGEPASGQGVGAFLQGYSVTEAAQVLGVSEKTIRRHIKAGRLSATLFNGPRGPEYRMENLELREQPAAVGAPQPEGESQDALAGPPPAPAYPSPQGGMQALARAELDGATAALLGEFQALLAAREQRIEELQQEKVQLAGQLGAVMERTRNLEERLKLLAAPQPRRAWWRRLIFRGKG